MRFSQSGYEARGGRIPGKHPLRCRANLAHIRQPGPHSGLEFQVEVLVTCSVVPSSLGSGLRIAKADRSRVSSEHLKSPRPESGLGFRCKSSNPFKVFPSRSAAATLNLNPQPGKPTPFQECRSGPRKGGGGLNESSFWYQTPLRLRGQQMPFPRPWQMIRY